MDMDVGELACTLTDSYAAESAWAPSIAMLALTEASLVTDLFAALPAAISSVDIVSRPVRRRDPGVCVAGTALKRLKVFAGVPA